MTVERNVRMLHSVCDRTARIATVNGPPIRRHSRPAARRLAGRGGQGAPVRALAAGVGAMARGYPGTPGERLRRARDAGQLWWASWRPALAPAAAPRA